VTPRTARVQVLQSKRGFALPAVLTVTTALTLVFLTALLSLEGLRQEARNALAVDGFQRAAMSAEAHIGFLALTEPFGPRSIHIGGQRADPETGIAAQPADAGGVGGSNVHEFLIDGTPYAMDFGDGSGRTLVASVQDAAGLVNLNFAQSQVATAAFERAGADPLLASTLADQLRDYTSSNGIRSLRGADAADYERAGAAPPPGRSLDTWAQLRGLLALKEDNSVDFERLREYSTVGPANSENVNTASAETLMTWFGISQGAAEDIVESRKSQPVSNLAALAISVPNDEEAQFYFPNGNLRLTFADPSISALYRSEFELTPDDPNRPFWIQDTELLRLPTQMRSPEDVSQLPRLPDIASPAPAG
jgi:type II secretory pathway component PulK